MRVGDGEAATERGAVPAHIRLLPVVRRIEVTLADRQLDRLRGIADRILSQDPRLACGRSPVPHVRAGIDESAWLVLGDAREIALMGALSSVTYEYRASLLARSGDLVAFSDGGNDAFEAYRADVLGQGPVLRLRPGLSADRCSMPLAERCRRDPVVLSRIIGRAKETGGLTLVPHIGLGSAWQLAATIARKTGLDIHVASPGARLTRRTNSKTWFSEVIASVLGRHALPPTFVVHGPAMLSERIRSLSRRAGRLVVKIPDSAGGAGNFSLRCADFAARSLHEIQRKAISILQADGWPGTFPLLVGLWEAPVLTSPSVQLWIPASEDGPPVIEGLFEQLLEGSEGAFVGSMPARLPEPWRTRLAEEAMQFASLFQMLGYFGRCSFDALLVGTSVEAAQLHWIECNGRWGGVSTPMTLVNRLHEASEAPPFVVIQSQAAKTRRLPFEAALDLLDDLLFVPRERPEGVILLSPVEIEEGSGAMLVSCSSSIEAAGALAQEAVGRLSRRPVQK